MYIYVFVCLVASHQLIIYDLLLQTQNVDLLCVSNSHDQLFITKNNPSYQTDGLYGK